MHVSGGTSDYPGTPVELATWDHSGSRPGSRSVQEYIRHLSPESLNGYSRAQSLAGTVAQHPRQNQLRYQVHNMPSPMRSDYGDVIDEEELEDENEYDEDYHEEEFRDESQADNVQPIGDVVVDVVMSDKEEEVLQRARSNVVFSCFVFICCNVFFGAAAFLVALSSKDAKLKEARRLGNISLSLNIFGILLSWLIVGVILALWWFGVIYMPFAPWRIRHYYDDNGDPLTESSLV